MIWWREEDNVRVQYHSSTLAGGNVNRQQGRSVEPTVSEEIVTAGIFKPLFTSTRLNDWLPGHTPLYLSRNNLPLYYTSPFSACM
jgi:hypothetical protein